MKLLLLISILVGQITNIPKIDETKEISPMNSCPFDTCDNF